MSEQTRPIRVMVVDDYGIYRRGIAVVLDLESDITVVGEAETAEEAVPLAGELRPDVVLLDIYLPGESGIEVCGRIRAASPGSQILMLTASDVESDLVAAIKAGATGYLLKDVGPDELADGIRKVRSGQALLSPSLASVLLGEFTQLVRDGAPAGGGSSADDLPTLTSREREVLGLVARGWSNRTVADELYISENTVKNHMRSILDKLQLSSRMEAAIYAVRNNLVEDPDSRTDAG
ncbi:response regulator transcription factor [Luteipulveratus sp. YIM 133132]|uniref:Response regulator transcription factor n=1 Tax=Luteipulveratus flavus TaxID=3031728 RepID=A0ABT6C1X2_9MICO|nr:MULTISPECIES: response regulator transcription factor [unclassified Luteipulveratus]MDE9367727.1 response regulator transcription factor [Luteipulveratus sp. YIM 133132]MDF8262904.1 response regulator transcription factor [Luteipulveratus sp. YIM 133296]